MEDSINKKIDFKFVVFIALLGSWWGLIKYYEVYNNQEISGDPVSNSIVVFSFFIFFPLVHIGLMLINMFLYQVAEKEKVKEKLNIRYNKSSKVFYNWWALLLIVAPVWGIAVIFSGLSVYSVILVILYGGFILKYFRGIYDLDYVIKHNLRCILWLLLYFVVFVIVYTVARI